MSNKKYLNRSLAAWKIENPNKVQQQKRKDHLKTRLRNQAYIAAEIERRGCCEFCGVTEHPKVYHWHHIDDEDPTKTTMGQLLHNGLNRLQQELDKCVLLCPTCHHKFHQDLCCMLDHRQQHIDGTFYDVKIVEVEEEDTSEIVNTVFNFFEK